jgi:aminoglycoside 6'-N-acetyltransferase I
MARATLKSPMNPRPYVSSDHDEWLRMRLALWPEETAETHLSDMTVWLARPDTVVLVAPHRQQGRLVGFAEVGTRSVADSCETTPVAYLEGWYVDPEAQRQGVGAALIGAAEDWARARGLREFASDTQLDNFTSQRAHTALGFSEVERVVLYRKEL